jgi:3-deoxy-D-manno-octulosonic acid kinase
LKPPEGFVERRLWSGRLWVRRGWEGRLPLAGESLEASFRGVSGVVRFAGRGAVWSAPAGDGERAVLRHYRHGGALAPLTRDVFVGRTPRPVTELAVSEELRRRGVRTPEVLALWWRYAAPWVYRADLITRQVGGGRDLAAYLADAKDPARRRALGEVGRALAAMHAAGLRHPDLNLKNLLVRPAGRGCEVWVLDLDRASVGEPLGEGERVAQLKRLERSFRKLSRAGALGSEREALAVLRAYFGRGWKGRLKAHWGQR